MGKGKSCKKKTPTTWDLPNKDKLLQFTGNGKSCMRKIAPYLRRCELLVVGSPRREVEPPAADALDQEAVVDVELDGGVQGLPPLGQHLLQLLRLDGRPG